MGFLGVDKVDVIFVNMNVDLDFWLFCIVINGYVYEVLL